MYAHSQKIRNTNNSQVFGSKKTKGPQQHKPKSEFEFLAFNATFSNFSAISWRPVLVVEEAGVHGENHRPWASNW